MGKTVAELIQEAHAQVEDVSPKQVADDIAAGNVVVVDVREPAEWGEHIAGAVQVPRGLLEYAADPESPRHIAELDPAGRVVVYCRSGARSTLATATLKMMGYKNVVNLKGGFSAWKDAGLPIVEQHAGL
jgi:rhodanese-related sulfurtransferase